MLGQRGQINLFSELGKGVDNGRKPPKPHGLRCVVALQQAREPPPTWSEERWPWTMFDRALAPWLPWGEEATAGRSSRSVWVVL